jgi:hypothetical protein
MTDKDAKFPLPVADTDTSGKEKSGDFLPPYSAHQKPPPQGYRISGTIPGPFPDFARAGPAPFRDMGGEPVYVASAIFGTNGQSVHPCKFASHLPQPCRVPYGGAELSHLGRLVQHFSAHSINVQQTHP